MSESESKELDQTNLFFGGVHVDFCSIPGGGGVEMVWILSTALWGTDAEKVKQKKKGARPVFNPIPSLIIQFQEKST